VKPILERQTVREILELSEYPSLEEVKANYKRLVKQYHPDVNKTLEAAEFMKRINKAYAIATGKEKPPQQPLPPPPPQRTYVVIRWGYGFGSSASSSSGTGYW
jgi:preprotein translocase subunit Sec63